MVIGVTGRYAAGKDEVSHLLSPCGFREINVDELGHRALEDKRDTVIGLFGRSILRADGSIDRRALGRIVFGDPKSLARLEAVLHPRMRDMVAAALRNREGNCVINAAVLFPMGLEAMTDMVIVVRAPFFTRYARARTRDGLSLGDFLARCRGQHKIVPKHVPGNVDIHIIWNTRNLPYLKNQLDTLILRYAPSAKKDGIK